MFTWICAQCGAEVPPSYSECPNCAKATATPPPEPIKPAPAPPPAPTAPPPARQTPTPAQPVFAPPPPPAAPVVDAVPQPQQVQYVYVKRGAPGWLVALGTAAAMIAAVGGLFYFLTNRKGGSGGSLAFETPKAAEEKAPAAPAGVASKHLEAVGVRIFEQGRKPVVRVTVVNHSPAEMADVEGAILIRGSDGKEVASIPMKLRAISPYGTADVNAPLVTSLRAYELPDWQFLKAELRVTQ